MSDKRTQSERCRAMATQGGQQCERRLGHTGNHEVTSRRPMREQANCQQEPPYPNHETVVMSLRDPLLTVHLPTPRCAIQEPHQTAACGEFAPCAKEQQDIARLTRRIRSLRGVITRLQNAAEECYDQGATRK